MPNFPGGIPGYGMPGYSVFDPSSIPSNPSSWLLNQLPFTPQVPIYTPHNTVSASGMMGGTPQYFYQPPAPEPTWPGTQYPPLPGPQYPQPQLPGQGQTPLQGTSQLGQDFGGQGAGSLAQDFLEGNWDVVYGSLVNTLKAAGAANAFLDWLRRQSGTYELQFLGGLGEQAAQGQIPTGKIQSFLNQLSGGRLG